MSMEEMQRMDRMGRRMRHAEEFKTLDRRELSKKNDKELAEWQSRHEPDEPQWRLAEHEWQRRITADQITATMRAARGQAWFGIAGLFIGALLTLLGQLLARFL
jgi:hypothetical protein